MKFALIDEEKSHHPVSRMSRVLGVTPAGYYAWKSRPSPARSIEDERIKKRIVFHHEASRGTYGVPRLYDDLADEGIQVSRKRIARLMREFGIAGVSGREGMRRRRKKSTVPETDAVADLVRRDFTADEPNHVWFADITYVPTWEGWLFLAVVMDACTKRIVGWSMRDDPKSDIALDALGMATTMRRPDAGLVHHSDRGAQYRSLAFGKCLHDSGSLPRAATLRATALSVVRCLSTLRLSIQRSSVVVGPRLIAAAEVPVACLDSRPVAVALELAT